MEEYFPPMGTDHQILDGREARPRALLFVIGGATLFLLILCVFGWWKQRTHTFSVPEAAITLDYSRTAKEALRSEQRLAIPGAWKDARAGLLPRIIGGSFDEPTWLIAPRWAKTPQNWNAIERYGVYAVFTHPDAPPSTRPIQLRDRTTWTSGIKRPLMRGQLMTEGTRISFAVNDSVLATDIPVTKPSAELLQGYDVSYTLQQSPLDSALLQRLVLGTQGLASWRADVSRIAWNSPTGTLTDWSLELRNTSSTLGQILATTTTMNRVSLLADGSASIRRLIVSPIATTTVQSGTSSATPLASCSTSRFHPFFQLSGLSLAHTWSQLGAMPPSFFQIGELNGQFTICLRERKDVDN